MMLHPLQKLSSQRCFQLLAQPTRGHVLKCEMKWMTRRKLVDATHAAVAALKGEISRFSISTVCEKRELFLPRR